MTPLKGNEIRKNYFNAMDYFKGLCLLGCF